MTNYVTDTAAGKSISAYVILKNGKEVATVRASYSNGGTCLVNIFHMDGTPFQYKRARGYGYDKFTAALSGLTIAGIELSDHCGRDENTEKLLKAYRKACEKLGGEVQYAGDFQKSWNKKAAKFGASFANWNRDNTGFSSLHIASGLDRLRMAGFTVIQAI